MPLRNTLPTMPVHSLVLSTTDTANPCTSHSQHIQLAGYSNTHCTPICKLPFSDHPISNCYRKHMHINLYVMMSYRTSGKLSHFHDCLTVRKNFTRIFFCDKQRVRTMWYVSVQPHQCTAFSTVLCCIPYSL